MRYEMRIALRYLRARRKDAFISITTLFTALGVMIGVAALTIVLSFVNGLEASIQARLLGMSPQIQILSARGSISDYGSLLRLAARVNGVSGSDPFINGQAILSSAHGASGALLRGIDPANATATRELRKFVEQGELSKLESKPPALDSGLSGALALGSGLAEKLKVHVGDRVRAVSPVMSEKSELSTSSADFVVGAIFNSGVSYLDRSIAFANLEVAQTFLGRIGRIDGIEVRLRSLDETRKISDELRRLFPYPYRVRDWTEFNQAATAGLELLKKVYATVLLLMIGVAAFNLVATLIMVVMEKRKDIAVLMAMGASQRDIRRIFVLKGLLVGTAGTAAGLLLGIAGCFILARYHFIHLPKDVFGLSTVPIRVEPMQFLMVAVASVALCLVATFYPSRQAASQLPVEIIRYE